MADVKQLITDFYRVASTRDFQRDIQFRVLSISPGGTTTTFDENDLVYARAASLPERAIGNVEAKYMGLNFNLPGVANYPGSNAYQITFYNDANNNLRQKFEDWTRDTFNDANSTGNYFTPTQSSTIELIQLDTQMNKVAQYQLVGVSIRSVGAINYDFANGNGNIVQFPVTMAYHYFTRKANP
jgi:hypothetical protein